MFIITDSDRSDADSNVIEKINQYDSFKTDNYFKNVYKLRSNKRFKVQSSQEIKFFKEKG